jgi:peptide-methionine (S)-S-oxide reductase
MRWRGHALGLALIVTAAGGLLSLALPGPAHAQSAETAVLAPEPIMPAHEAAGLKTAVFSGGCFWGVEGVFSHVTGVTSAVSGYHGGMPNTANYDAVSSGATGHAESVRVTYDPAKIRYDQLLRVFFSVVIDPTQRDRQGPDTGTQYRSALVPQSDEQRRVASAYLAQLAGAHVWKGKIATRIETARSFYAAESYHQDFMLKNPAHPYIAYWDAPKVAALKRMFPALYKADFTRN